PGGCARPGSKFAVSIRRPAVGHPSTRGWWLHSSRAAQTRSTRPDDAHRPRAMRAWGDLPGDDPERDRAATEAELAAAGIDLDTNPPGVQSTGDETQPSGYHDTHTHYA